MTATELLLSVAPENLWHWSLVFMRISGMLAILPAFGDRMIPVRVRLAIAVAFATIVAPALPPVDIPTDQRLLLIVILELATGLFFGLMLRMLVFALQVAGAIAAQSTSVSQIFGGSAGADPQPAMTHFLVISAMALATLLGLHIKITVYILTSFRLVPMAVILPAGVVADLALSEVTRAFGLALSLAAPFVIASLLYNVVLGFINRAMPQLMVSFVGAPALTAGGLLLFFLSAPLILSIWIGAFHDAMLSPFGAD